MTKTDEGLRPGEATTLPGGVVKMTRAQEDEYLERVGGLPEATLDVSGVVWREVGPESDPQACLRGCVRVLGTAALLEAHAVSFVGNDGVTRAEAASDDDETRFDDPAVNDRIELIWHGLDLQGPPDVTTIGSRSYAVFMVPGTN